MRFLADMGVSLRIVEWLRTQGHDARHLREDRLQRLPDQEIFSRAVTENRIVLTFDLDFGEIAALSTGRKTGLIVFRLHNTRTAHVIERPQVVLSAFAPALEQGAVALVQESRIRVRHLPSRGEGSRRRT